MSKNNITWAYIAGFLDGDGWISHSEWKGKTKNRYGNKNIIYNIGLTQLATCKKEMKMIYDFLCFHNINAFYIERKQKGTIKGTADMINIQIKEHESVVKFLNKIKRFLLIKKIIAEQCLSYIKSKISKRRMINRQKNSILEKQNAKKKWSDKEIKILKAMLENNDSNITIAYVLGRSVDSVAKKINRLKIGRYIIGK